MSMEEIERLTKTYADARQIVKDRVDSFEDAKRALLRRRLPGIRTAVERAQELHDELKNAIDAHRGEFKKPKSRILHGIKVGIQKGKGVLTYANAEQVVKLIKKHLSDQQDTLLNVKETPAKAAIQNLPADKLKKIGCEIKNTGDQVLIKAQDSELDKLVDSLLNDGDNELDEEAAE